MNVTNTLSKSESVPRDLRRRRLLPGDDEPAAVSAPQQILRSALDALSDGRISAVVELFGERLRFNDHALALEFTEKTRLTEFFEKSRELFPDTRLELLSLFEDGHHAIAEWKLAATQTVGYSSTSYRFRISVAGTTIVHIEKGRIVQWSDYYDQNSSRRINLAAFFAQWIGY
jgi:steroid delta-isomerase-like uncharacterized protein